MVVPSLPEPPPRPGPVHPVLATGCGLLYAGQMVWAGLGATAMHAYFAAWFDAPMQGVMLVPIFLGAVIGSIGGLGVRRAILAVGWPRDPWAVRSAGAKLWILL